MSDRARDMLCTALEMAERGLDIYDRAVKACPDAMGAQVFKMLKEDEAAFKAVIEKTYEGISKGRDWEAACTLPPEGERDVRAVIARLADKYKVDQSCQTDMQALEMGIDFEKAWVGFFEGHLDKAEPGAEKEFVRRMIQEGRTHAEMLNDLSYFYTDPQGWAMGTHKPRLDGA